MREDILKNGITSVFNQGMVLILITLNLLMRLKYLLVKDKKLEWVDI